MILIFTDYGLDGPYIGTINAVLSTSIPGCPVICLMADAPGFNPRHSAYLLSAFTTPYPQDTVIFAVIDPGVGSGIHKPVIINADGRWYVGPDNGLFEIVSRNASSLECYEILWKPESLSSTFHGRDLYAPVCSMLARGLMPDSSLFEMERRTDLPDDLFEIIYCDHFGNGMTGIHAGTLTYKMTLKCGDFCFRHGSYFASVSPGEFFWHENSYGLVEFSVNQGSASRDLGLGPGDEIRIL